MEKWLPWFILILSVLLIVGVVSLSGCTSSLEPADQQQVDSSSSSGTTGEPGPMGAPPEGFPQEGEWPPPE